MLPDRKSFAFALIASVLSAAAVAAGDAQKQIDDVFAPWTHSDTPGCSVAATQDGRIVLERGYGMADLEQGVAIRPHTVFNMASVSKQFTAASIVLLADQGKLSLDDDVRKFVPELPDYGKTITIRHLGNHTSGIRDWLDLVALGGWNWVDEMPTQRVLDVIVRQKQLNFTPGSKYSYSNSGYILLAVIIERVSGKTLGPFAEEHIFKPLGMLHSRFYDDRRMIMQNRAVGHYRETDGILRVWRPTYEIVGDGALLTTVEDMVLWERNFLEPRLGNKPQHVIAQLIEPARLNDGSTIDYAFGLAVGEYRGLRTVSHAGGIPGYSTYMLRFPDQRFSVQLMCNQGDLPSSQLAQSVAEVYLGSQFKTADKATPESREARKPTPRISLTAAKLAEFAGAFYSDEIDATHRISVDGDALSVRVGYLPADRWMPVGVDRFESEDGMIIVFHRGSGHRVTGYTLDTGRAQGLGFKRKSAQSPRG